MLELIQRIELWQSVLEALKKEREDPFASTGLCLYLTRQGYEMCYHGSPTNQFAEIRKYKPKSFFRGTYYWWQIRNSRGLERRIGVVENVIADITAEIDKRNEPQTS